VQINKWDFHRKKSGVRGQSQESDLTIQREELEPTKEAGGIAHVNSGDGNILGNNCTGSDDHLVANGDREDCRICPDTYSITKFGWSPKLWFASRSTVTEQIVNEHRAVRNETVVANRDEIADERVGLNAASLADGGSLLYLNERSNESIVADLTAVQVCRLYDGNIRAELNIDEPDRTLFNWIHIAEF
jgi:hypothetical protein